MVEKFDPKCDCTCHKIFGEVLACIQCKCSEKWFSNKEVEE